MKIALVHDYLREYGGAERVVEVLHEIWPDAPLYTSFVDWNTLGAHADRFRSWNIQTSWVQHNPLVKKLHSPLRFLAPKVWKSFDLSDYDVVVSSSGWYMCRGVITKKDRKTGRREDRKTIRQENGKTVLQRSELYSEASLTAQRSHCLHICYIHHPPRNLYGYETGGLVKKYWPVKVYAGIINFFLRHYDYETAQNVDYFIANSQETARRVKKFYRRESTVIYPPVEISRQTTDDRGQNEKKYFLSVGRLTYSKQIDVIIRACNEMKLPLKIVGVGKEKEELMALAGPTIEFVGGVSDEELSKLYAGAKALIFCALDEDFGMVPVEAMGYGVPVIALAQGGVKETVVDGETGVWFDAPEVESLVQAIKRFETEKKDWTEACVNQAKKFSKERFMKEIQEFVEGKYTGK